MKKIFFVVGRTASGKDSLTNIVAKEMNMKILKSYATRPIRQDDPKDAEAHIYIKPEDVEQYKSRMFAYTKIGQFEYFSTIDQLKENDFYIIDPQGIDFVRKSNIKDFKMCVIYIYVPEDIRIDRALKVRGDNIEAFEKRCAKEMEQFNRFEESEDWDHLIVNTNLEDSIEDFKEIIRIEKSDLT